MNLSKKIPYINISNSDNIINHIDTANAGEDSFKDLKEEEGKIKEEMFDEKSFNDLYNKLFEILYLWKERSEGYYSKDEIFYMTALFIVREYIPAILMMRGLGRGENILDENTEKILDYQYDRALKFFKKAINFNPNNPNYYYEYANCLRQSGKSKEAEIFFKKAFELSL
jgi:tetratricopeptide (TPR) repeat protein